MDYNTNHGGSDNNVDFSIGYSYKDVEYTPKPAQIPTASDNAMETVNRLNSWIYEKSTKITTTEHQRRKIKACLKHFYKFINKIRAVYSDINALEYLEESHRIPSEIDCVLDEILGTEFQHGCYSAGIAMIENEVKYHKDKLLTPSTQTGAIPQIFKNVFFAFNCVFESIKQVMNKTHDEIVEFSNNFNPTRVKPAPSAEVKNTIYITLRLPSQMTTTSGKSPAKITSSKGKPKMRPISKGLGTIPEDSSINSFTNMITA